MLSYNTNIDKFFEITNKSIDTMIDLISKGISYKYESFIDALVESVKVYGYIPYSREHYENIVKNDKRLIIKNNKIYLKKYASFNLKLKDIVTNPHRSNKIKETFTDKEREYYRLLKKIRRNQNWNDISGGDINIENLELLFPEIKRVLEAECKKSKKNTFLLFKMFMTELHYTINDNTVSL